MGTRAHRSGTHEKRSCIRHKCSCDRGRDKADQSQFPARGEKPRWPHTMAEVSGTHLPGLGRALVVREFMPVNIPVTVQTAGWTLSGWQVLKLHHSRPSPENLGHSVQLKGEEN